LRASELQAEFVFFRSILCHVCSEIRDVWKKTGAWFYKGLPNYELPNRANGEANNEHREQTKKSIRTTKLGMEIESDDDDDDGVMESMKDDGRITRNGSIATGLLRTRNLFNLRLSNGAVTTTTATSATLGSRLTLDDAPVSAKKSPISPYSRQTSSSDSQKSAYSLNHPPNAELDYGGIAPLRQRRNSISSCYSITECASGTENTMMNHLSESLIAYVNVSDISSSIATQIIANQSYSAGLSCP